MYRILYPSQVGSNGIAFGRCQGMNVIESQCSIASVKFRWNLSTATKVIPRYVSTDPGAFRRSLTISILRRAFDRRLLKDTNGPLTEKDQRPKSSLSIFVYNEIYNKGRRVFWTIRKISLLFETGLDFLVGRRSLHLWPTAIYCSERQSSV